MRREREAAEAPQSHGSVIDSDLVGVDPAMRKGTALIDKVSEGGFGLRRLHHWVVVPYSIP